MKSFRIKLFSFKVVSTCSGNRKNDPVRSLSTKLGPGFIVLAVLALVAVAEARTITATSCSQTDVYTAIKAAVAGDTVTIPAGTCAWTSRVSWNAPANVTLMGAGTSATV